MNKLNKYSSLFLLAVISFFIIPKEVIHEFYGHEDTAHCHSDNGSVPVLEPQHIHCDFLNINVPVYFFSLTFFQSPEASVNSPFIQQTFDVLIASHIRLSSLRGPPFQTNL